MRQRLFVPIVFVLSTGARYAQKETNVLMRDGGTWGIQKAEIER